MRSYIISVIPHTQWPGKSTFWKVFMAFIPSILRRNFAALFKQQKKKKSKRDNWTTGRGNHEPYLKKKDLNGPIFVIKLHESTMRTGHIIWTWTFGCAHTHIRLENALKISWNNGCDYSRYHKIVSAYEHRNGGSLAIFLRQYFHTISNTAEQ